MLGVAPDNTLRGSGSTSVNGKLVSSIRGDNVSFTPHSESCSVGTFAARSKRNTMRASSGPSPAAPPTYSSPSPAAASAVTPAHADPTDTSAALRVSALIFESCWTPPSPEPTRLRAKRYSSCASRSAMSSASWALPYLLTQPPPRR